MLKVKRMVSRVKYLLESNRYILCKALKTYIDKIPVNNFDEDLFYKVFTNEFFEEFPYIEAVYVLNKDGVQISNNSVNPIFYSKIPKEIKGYDKSNRPYYKEAVAKKDCTITQSYTSIVSSDLNATISIPVLNENNEIIYIYCFNIDLKGFMFNQDFDVNKERFDFIVKIFYSIFSIILALLSLKLIIWAVSSLTDLSPDIKHIFEGVILITLSIAIFDLARTIFEEEVLIYKDPRKHSETRKTMTRFLASIIIAVSIEALMLVFKFAMIEPTKLLYSLGLFVSVGVLIISLGIYLFLDSKAEINIKRFERERK
jgi:hypothetical protein